MIRRSRWRQPRNATLEAARLSRLQRIRVREEERLRVSRVKEIDELVEKCRTQLLDLVCEKDMLQRRPNPLWNYTTKEANITGKNNITTTLLVSASREFNFPSRVLVDEYLEMLFTSSRLIKMNHTDLWRNTDEDEDEEDDLDESSSTSTRKKRLRESQAPRSQGNWLLRNGFGEKICETTERAAYRAVCRSLMSILGRMLSSLHGVTVMSYSDIHLFADKAPNLPPVVASMIPGTGQSDYASKALREAMRRGQRRKRRKPSSDSAFVQRAAVVETLLSHCQVSAPLLQMFPIAWQRELLSNIVILATSIIGDLSEGLEFHVLGHRLSFVFSPISEEDMLRSIITSSNSFGRRRDDTEAFEAAVHATAANVYDSLNFLDRWHERALGSGVLRSQIANLIARVVLTIVGDLLQGARMDLWTKHAGGPRLVAGLDYRLTKKNEDEAI